MRGDQFRKINRDWWKLKDAAKGYFAEEAGKVGKSYSATHRAYSGTVLEAKHGGKRDADDGMVGDPEQIRKYFETGSFRESLDGGRDGSSERRDDK